MCFKIPLIWQPCWGCWSFTFWLLCLSSVRRLFPLSLLFWDLNMPIWWFNAKRAEYFGRVGEGHASPNTTAVVMAVSQLGNPRWRQTHCMCVLSRRRTCGLNSNHKSHLCVCVCVFRLNKWDMTWWLNDSRTTANWPEIHVHCINCLVAICKTLSLS